jgi:hypothetical protein
MSFWKEYSTMQEVKNSPLLPLSKGLNVFLILLILLGIGTPMRAQLSTTGTISGAVTDASGALVPGAEVRITDVDTGLVTVAKANGSGEFSANGLPVGHYDVRVVAPGLAAYRQVGIYLEPAAEFRVAAHLSPEAVSSEVTVQAQREQVQTETPEVSNEVYEQQVVELPLNGRSYEGLATLMPGVTNLDAGTALGSGGYVTQNSMNINGTGQTGTLYTVDGMWNMQTSNMQETTITPNPEAISERV